MVCLFNFAEHFFRGVKIQTFFFSLQKKQMDILRPLENGSQAFLAITRSNDNNILGLFFDGYEVSLDWIQRDSDKNITGINPMSNLAKQLLNITLRDSDKGLKVEFGLDIFDDHEEFYIVQSPKDNLPCVYFEKDGKHALTTEIFMDLVGNKGYCKCTDAKTFEEFVDVRKISNTEMFL